MDNVEEDEEDMDDDPEALAELEKRKEEIIDEFLEIAFSKKEDVIEELKKECKRLKLTRDAEKKRILEVESAMDLKRKEGIKEVKKKLN